MSFNSTKVETSTKSKVTKSKVKTKCKGKEKVTESLEEVLNADNSNNTGGDKNLPTINEQTNRKSYTSHCGSYKDPDDSSEDKEPDRRIRKNKKKNK